MSARADWLGMRLSVLTAVGRPEYGYLAELRDSLAPLAGDTDIEWVLYVDDPSTSEHRVLDIASSGPLAVTVIKNHYFQARGPAHARNQALAAATGDWVLIADSDDTVRPEGVRALLEAALTHDVAWAAGRTTDIDDLGNHLWDGPEDPYTGLIPAGQYFVDTLRNDAIPIFNNSVVFRTQALKDAGGWPTDLRSEDTAMMAVVTSRHDGYWVPEWVTNYRQHSASITAQPDWESRRREYVEMMQRVAGHQ